MLRSSGGAPHHEIGTSEDVEVGGVVTGEEGGVEELAQLPGRVGDLDAEDVVAGLRRRQVMGLATDPADTGRDSRHLLHRPADAEGLEAAQFRHDEEAVGDLALVVEEDVDLAVPFESSDRIDRDPGHSVSLPPRLPLVPPSVAFARVALDIENR
jgi:hypothetical protein